MKNLHSPRARVAHRVGCPRVADPSVQNAAAAGIAQSAIAFKPEPLPPCCRASRDSRYASKLSILSWQRSLAEFAAVHDGGAPVTATLQVSLEDAAAPVGFNYVVLYDSRVQEVILTQKPEATAW
jgi:hypothetical protein